MKVGRNTLCPCGSGKKYKKCCLEKDQQNKSIKGTLTKAFEMTGGDDFFHRFIFQMSQIRDCISPREERITYDNFYSTIFENLLEAKIARTHCLNLIEQHTKNVQEGKDAYIKGTQINVDKPIADDLNLFFKDFFIRGVMAIDALFRHCAYMGYPISGFFSEKDKTKKRAITESTLPKDALDGMLRYIENHQKTWYTVFRDLRDRIIHHGWKLDKIVYYPVPGNKLGIRYPRIKGQSIEDILNISWNNITRLCEEAIVMLASHKLPPYLVILEFPPEKRDPTMPIRFAVRHKDFPEANFNCS